MGHPISLQLAVHLKSPLPAEPGTSLPLAVLPTSRKRNLPLAEVPVEPATNKIDITENTIFLICSNRNPPVSTKLEDSFAKETLDS